MDNNYNCSGCGCPIDNHDRVKLVTTNDGLFFFHLNGVCQNAWQQREDRKKFDQALDVQQRQWFM